MHKEAREVLRVRFRLNFLEYADIVEVTGACKEFVVARASLYNMSKRV